MTNLEQYIYSKLEAMQTEKAQQPIHPNMLTKSEFLSAVDKDIRKILNKMFIEKKIKIHPTKDAPIQDFIELVKE